MITKLKHIKITKRHLLAIFILSVIAAMAIASSVVYADESKEMAPGQSTPEQSAPEQVSPTDSDKSGNWATIDDAKAYQYEDGTYAMGLVEIDGSKYFFDEDHKMVTGWQEIDGKKHYFKSTGVMATGLTKIGDAKYYFKTSGAMATGLTTIQKDKYYFATNGKMFTGFKKISGKQYYFQKSGKMLKGTKKTIDKKMCYFDSKGVLTRSIDKTKPMVALTYDDGPSSNTNTILNTLKKYKGVATFFVVGNRVSAFSSTVKKAHKMGCEIGNHTYSHKILTSVGSSTIRSQILKTNKAIKKRTGSYAAVMRPPGGSHNATVRRNVKAPLILWSIDTRDWEHRNASRTISSVLNHIKDGDIVLMHDLYAPTAKASKTIIPKLTKRGYQLVTVSELADCRGGMKKGKVYYRLRR